MNRYAIALAVLTCAGTAWADDTIKHPGDHPDYKVEIEPHGLIGWDGVFGGTGFGVGARFGIPIVKNGFIPSINNSVAISFGLDFLHYSTNCNWYRRGGFRCNANYLFFPVAMQWNFYVAQKWSVFGEPGLVLYHGFFDDCVPGEEFCNNVPSHTGVRPAFWAGGRYHFSETAALTMRIGYPSFSIGVSFFL
jgi:hypothetical protein